MIITNIFHGIPLQSTTKIIAEMCNWLNGLKPNYKFILECNMIVNFTNYVWALKNNMSKFVKINVYFEKKSSQLNLLFRHTETVTNIPITIQFL